MTDHPAPDHPPRPDEGHEPGHGRHGWMMIACCIPMLAIALVLVATGVVSPGFLFVAVACTAMMALMMRGMGHDDEADSSTRTGGSAKPASRPGDPRSRQ
jgi:hypothetical protein